MDIQIQMLGTGSAFATQYDNNNALFTCNGYRLLVDCGVTAPRALHQMGIPFDEINGIFISHLHADHVGGLEEYAFQMYYVYKKRPVLWVPSVLRTPIWEHTLRGGMENPAECIDTLEHYFEVKELEAGIPQEIHPGLTLEIMPTLHIPGKPSFGIYMNDALYFSCDSMFDAERLTALRRERGLKHVLHDCQLQGKGYIHATLDELLTLPDELQAITRLMHYGDAKEQFEGKTGRMTFIEQRVPYTFTV
ncbi:MBL fold metallo-hydrolase [Gorillibacterium sp. sgz5001074]|uniref:MBL fold metallo-hydrolase n=1 Tax=Gorillibacterium sp. sgz5001074 TaxID=3446695 RepID=UPI003F67DB6B